MGDAGGRSIVVPASMQMSRKAAESRHPREQVRAFGFAGGSNGATVWSEAAHGVASPAPLQCAQRSVGLVMPSPSRLSFVIMLLLAAPTFAGPICPGGTDCGRTAMSGVAMPGANEKRKTGFADSVFARSLSQANARFDANDDAEAAGLYDLVVASPNFATLRTRTQHEVLVRASVVAWRQRRLERALALGERAFALSPNNPDDLSRTLTFQQALGHTADAAATTIAFARRNADALSRVTPSLIYRLDHALADDPQRQADYLQALLDAQWDDPTEDSSSLWYDLALARVRRGEAAQARAAIARVVAPEFVIRLRDDKRFDALVDRDDPAFDPKVASQRTIEALRAKAARLPYSLDVRQALLSALLVAGDLQALLQLSDELQRAVEAGGDPPAYDDPDKLTWVLNTRAIALRRLGRIDEATALMERIHRDPEQGRPNVSQAINLGMYDCQVGHPERALQRLAGIVDSDVSDYGRTQIAAVRLYAAVAMQDRAAQARAFDFIRRHRKDSQETYLDALLLLGRVDEAAKRYIARLASEDERADALFELQDHLRAEPLPGDRATDASRKALLARADVRAAVERVGRIEHHDVWIGYAF